MFGKKNGAGGKGKGKNGSGVSFAYTIPEEDIDRDSDWGAPNYANAHSYSTQKNFEKAVNKLHVFLYAVLGVLVLSCFICAALLVFGTQYEVAYADDGSTAMCRIQ